MEQGVDRAARLLSRAYAAGSISGESRDALLAVPGIGLDVAGGLGSDVSGPELLLVTILVDDSYSIESHQPAIQSGHELALEAVGNEAAAASLIHTRLLNGGVLSPYRSLNNAVRLSSNTFHLSDRGTPLYRESIITLGTVMAKAREQEDNGRNVRTFTLIITDGEDNRSAPLGTGHVRCLVTDMLTYATNHIVAGMGIGDPDTFRRVFSEMGIPRQWILTPGSFTDDIRDMFHSVAASLQLAASSKAGFYQLAAESLSPSS